MCLHLHMNYFELFQLPLKPVVDKESVMNRYILLQKQFHPDFNPTGDAQLQDEVLQKSADINKAYKIFLHPDLTIEYFLKTMGILADDEKYKLPNEFLVEVMEINEILPDDSQQAKAAIEQLEVQLSNEVKSIVEGYGKGEEDEALLLKLKEIHFKKKYLTRILDRFID